MSHPIAEADASAPAPVAGDAPGQHDRPPGGRRAVLPLTTPPAAGDSAHDAYCGLRGLGSNGTENWLKQLTREELLS